jgi:hypothetical protein
MLASLSANGTAWVSTTKGSFGLGSSPSPTCSQCGRRHRRRREPETDLGKVPGREERNREAVSLDDSGP